MEKKNRKNRRQVTKGLGVYLQLINPRPSTEIGLLWFFRTPIIIQRRLLDSGRPVNRHVI